jgi:hypothetical protein
MLTLVGAPGLPAAIASPNIDMASQDIVALLLVSLRALRTDAQRPGSVTSS